MVKSEKAKFISLIVLIGFAMATIYHYFQGIYIGLGYPHNTFLFASDEKFSDFFMPLNIVKDFNPYSPQNGNWAVYFPFSYLFFYIFELLNKVFEFFTLTNPVVMFSNANVKIWVTKSMLYSFLAYTTCFVGFFTYYNYSSLKNIFNNKLDLISNMFILSFLTYPFLFLIDRGNPDGYIFIFTALFLIYFIKEKYKTSAVLLSVSIAMKAFPGVFLLLFIKKRKFKELFLSISLCIALSLISLFIFKGNFSDNLVKSFENLAFYKNHYVIGDLGLAYGNSIFAAIKFMSSLFINSFDINKFVQISSFFSIILSLALFAFVFLRKKFLWKDIAILTFSLFLLPYISADYRLILIFLPLYLFINEEKTSKYDKIYCVLFGLLLIPKNYLYIANNISVSILITPIILTLFLALLIIEHFELKKEKH